MYQILKRAIAPLNIIFASFLLLLIVFTTNALLYKNSTVPNLSSAFLTTGTEDSRHFLTVNFDIDSQEKANFQNLARKFGVSFSGESIEVGLNDQLFAWAALLNKSSFGIQAYAQQLRFNSLSPLTITGNSDLQSWEFVDGVPQSTILYYQGVGTKNLLPQVLQGITKTESGAWALFANDNVLNAVWVFKITDRSLLEEALTALVLADRDKVTTDTKLTEGVVDTNRVYNYLQTGAPLTMGILGNKLIITTGEEAFRYLYRVNSGQENNLGNSTLFNETAGLLKSQSLGLYLTPTNMSATVDLKNIGGLINLEILSKLDEANVAEKIQAISVGVNENLMLEGVVNLR